MIRIFSSQIPDPYHLTRLFMPLTKLCCALLYHNKNKSFRYRFSLGIVPFSKIFKVTAVPVRFCALCVRNFASCLVYANFFQSEHIFAA
jgi:hypothetical protein